MSADDYIKLQNRVTQLEHRVVEQEDELQAYRATIDTVLQKLALLESKQQPQLSANDHRSSVKPLGLAPRNLSRSAVNLRNGSTTSNTPTPPKFRFHNYKNVLNDSNNNASEGSTPRSIGRRIVSPSSDMSSPRSQINGGSPAIILNEGRGIGGSLERTSTDLSPMTPVRRWPSSSDVPDKRKINSGLQQNGMTTGQNQPYPTSPHPTKVNGSMVNLSMSARSLSHIAHMGVRKPPYYNPDERCLYFYLRNRCVPLYAPADLLNAAAMEPSPLPKSAPKIDWVYGYRGRDCRNNVYYLPAGEIAYFTSTIVVLYNLEEHTQRHYTAHTSDIKCLALHPSRIFLASGQIAKHSGHRAEVRVWDSISLHTAKVLSEFDRGVSALAFSKLDGGQLLAVAEDSFDHCLMIYDWQRELKVACAKSGTDQLLYCEWHPRNKKLLATCGKNQVTMWTFDGMNLSAVQAVFEGRDRPKYFLCLKYLDNGNLVSGDSSGGLCLWDSAKGAMLRRSKGAHDGSVFSLCCTAAGRFVSGGGKDRKLVEWDDGLMPTGRQYVLDESFGPVRHICQGKGAALLVSTTHNEILLGDFPVNQSNASNFIRLVQAHGDELCALASHPRQSLFATGAYDKTLRLWDANLHKTLWITELADPIQCLGFHPEGTLMVVGTSVGRWLIVDTLRKGAPILSGEHGTNIVSCVAYSPDGVLLAVGSHNGSVAIYDVKNEYVLLGYCQLLQNTKYVGVHGTVPFVERMEPSHATNEWKGSASTDALPFLIVGQQIQKLTNIQPF